VSVDGNRPVEAIQVEIRQIIAARLPAPDQTAAG